MNEELLKLEIAAEVNALRLTIYSIQPNAEAIHATLLPQVRDKYAKDIKRQQASLDLLKAALSTIK